MGLWLAVWVGVPAVCVECEVLRLGEAGAQLRLDPPAAFPRLGVP